MNRIIKTFTIGLVLTVLLSSCRKDINMPYFGYEYIGGDGEKVEFYIDQLEKEVGVFTKPFVDIEGPAFRYDINDSDKAHFGFVQDFYGLIFVSLKSDLPVFYEGVRYHYVNDGKHMDKAGNVLFYLSSRYTIPTSFEGWVEFHRGEGDVDFYLEFDIEYPGRETIRGEFYFYKRLIEENSVPWRDWIRPAEENKGEKERWIEYTWDDIALP